MSSLIEKLNNLPPDPGCYIFRDTHKRILYIGKAKVLRNRVRSYFKQSHSDLKTVELVKKIADVETIVTDTELEAYLLEARLIRQHQPPYNMELKGGVRYAYIRLTKELFPRLETARDVKSTDTVFGPYAAAAARKNLIRLANHAFLLRTGKTKPVKVAPDTYVIRCAVPPWRRTVTRAEYEHDLVRAQRLLKGDTDGLLEQLTIEMKDYATQQRFELARLRRDQIKAIKHAQEEQKVELRRRYDQHVIVAVPVADTAVVHVLAIRKGVLVGRDVQRVVLPHTADDMAGILVDFMMQYYLEHTPPQEIVIEQPLPRAAVVAAFLQKVSGHQVVFTVPRRGAKRKLLLLLKKNVLLSLSHGDRAIADLQAALRLAVPPRTIVCFDISNLGANDIVASMVQFVDGVPDKKNYRRFKIRNQDFQSDVDAMEQVVVRRFTRLQAEKKTLPDLIVIDGGKTQLGAATKALYRAGLTGRIPLISLAKKMEEIYLPGAPIPVRLSRKEPALQLLQKIRDEAHRFAITYHRLVRGKRQLAAIEKKP